MKTSEKYKYNTVAVPISIPIIHIRGILQYGSLLLVVILI